MTQPYAPIVCAECGQEVLQEVQVVVRCPLGWSAISLADLTDPHVVLVGTAWETGDWRCGCRAVSPTGLEPLAPTALRSYTRDGPSGAYRRWSEPWERYYLARARKRLMAVPADTVQSPRAEARVSQALVAQVKALVAAGLSIHDAGRQVALPDRSVRRILEHHEDSEALSP